VTLAAIAASGVVGAVWSVGGVGAVVKARGLPQVLSAARPATTDLDAMVSAERAFATLAAAKGVRAAFLEYLAPDAVGFQPALGSARAVYERGPAPANPLATLLEWEPKVGEMAASGDLGYLTGPFSIGPRDRARPPQHGCYFSIWKKQGDGNWRVFIDYGVSSAKPVAFAVTSFKQGLARVPQSGSGAGSKGEIDAADRALNRAVGERGWQALGDVLANDARLHREGEQPLTTRAEARRWLESPAGPDVVSLTFVDGGAAASGDLGYSYGRYQTSSARAKTTSGYYVRMWRREAGDTWRVVVDVASPAGS
jgi:ketosteroid isomerase-like protein